MSIPSPKYTPFLRWQNRFNRLGNSRAIYYLTRETFDILRMTTKNQQEYKIAESIRKAILQIHEGEDSPHRRFVLPESGLPCVHIAAPGVNEGEKEDTGAILASLGDANDFIGEHSGGERKIVILHYISQGYNELGGYEDMNVPIAPFLLGNEVVEQELPQEVAVVFEGKMVKLMPTDPLFEDPTGYEALGVLRCQLSEVRVSNDPDSVSYEQSLAMDRIIVEESPGINITGRPGTGKTTVAQIGVPEVLLQDGPRRKMRNILYLTTTHELKSEARREVENIIKHVYGIGSRPRDLRVILQNLETNVRYQTRDNLISIDPRSERSIDSGSVMSDIINDAKSASKSLQGDEKETWKAIERNWLSSKERQSELNRVLKNTVFGLFGSISGFVEWYEKVFGGQEIRGKPGIWKDVFERMRLNMYQPWTTRFVEEELVDRESIDIWDEENNHDIFLSDFWNPFLDIVSKGSDAGKVEYRKGKERIDSLVDLLRHRLIGGKLFGDDGIGHWTYSSVMHKIDSDIEESRIEGKGIWDQKYHNSFDAIIIDESQDFSVRELAIILKRFAIRGSSIESEKHSRDYTPFLFLAAGDPLQTIEGSIFTARNKHINAIFEDWKRGIREETRADPRIDVEADIGLSNISYLPLVTNHRNANPIVECSVNPIIEEMVGLAKRELHIRRSIFKQAPASSRRGMVVRWNDESFNDPQQKDLAEDLWDLLSKRVRKQIDDARENPVRANEKATVGLMLPVPDIDNEEDVIKALSEFEELSKITDSVKKLFRSKAIKKGKMDWNRELLRRAGIYNVASVKGITLECAIAVGFGDRAAEEASPYERLTRLSHYLVACSRPQFVLFTFEKEHPEIGLEDKMKTSIREMTIKDLEPLLRRVEVDLDPTKSLDRAMNYPDDIGFWALTKSSLETLKKSSDSIDDAQSSSSWGDAIVFVEVLREMNSYFHRNVPDFLRAQESIPEQGSDKMNEIIRGANKLRRPELLDHEKGAARNLEDPSPIELVRTYLFWRHFLNGGDRDPSLSERLPKAAGWVTLAEDGPTEDALSRIIKEPEGKSFFPDWNRKGGSKRPTRPEHRDSVIDLEIPEGWWFKDRKYPMIQPNVWSTPFDLLISLVKRYKAEKGESYGQLTPEQWEEEEWSDLQEHDTNLLEIEWFLIASRKPDDLWKIIEKQDPEGRAASLNWVMGILTGDETDQRLVDAVNKWSSDQTIKSDLFELFRGWIDNRSLKVDNGGRTTFDVFEDALPGQLALLFRDKTSAKWLDGIIQKVVKSLYTKDGKGKLSRALDLQDAKTILTKIKDRSSAGNRAFADLILGLVHAIQSGDGESLQKWLIEGSLDELKKKNGKGRDITERAIMLLLDYGLEDQGIGSHMYSRWLGGRLDKVWNDGRWVNAQSKKMMELFTSITGGPDGQRRDKALVNGGLASHAANKLRSTFRPKLDSFSEELFVDCVIAGGEPKTNGHPVLRYLLWLNMEEDKRNDPKSDPLDLLDINDKSHRSPGRPQGHGAMVSEGLATVFREGHNYWNGMTYPDEYGGYSGELEVTCYNRARENVERIMSQRGMITGTPQFREGFLREGRVPPPTFSGYAKDDTDANSLREQVSHYSNSNPGIRGYLSIKERGRPMTFSELREAHWNFRLAGAYREAALISLCEGVILSREQKLAHHHALDFLHMDEINRKARGSIISRSIQRRNNREPRMTRREMDNIRSRVTKRETTRLMEDLSNVDNSELIGKILLKALRNSLFERPGIYVDHVQVDRRWARRSSRSGSWSRQEALASSPTSVLFLVVDGDDIVPRADRPISGSGGLELLEAGALDELREINPHSPMERPRSRKSTKRGRGVATLCEADHQDIREQYRINREKGMDHRQAMRDLPVISGESDLEVEAKPELIVRSTRALLPYVLLAEEARREFQQINSATWFRDPLDLSQFYVADGWGATPKDEAYEILEREALLDMLNEEGDGWMVEIFNLLRNINSSGKWGQNEVIEMQECIIRNAPTEGLKRMARTVLLGKQ